MQGPNFTAHASELKLGEDRCTCCGRRLKGKFAWLELDQEKNVYTDSGMVERSQGWFPFGMTCARNLLKELIETGKQETRR